MVGGVETTYLVSLTSLCGDILEKCSKMKKLLTTIFLIINLVNAKRDPQLQKQLDKILGKLIYENENFKEEVQLHEGITKKIEIPDFLREIIEESSKQGQIMKPGLRDTITDLAMIHGVIKVTSKGKI